MLYTKIGSKYTRKYGKTLQELSKDLLISMPTIIRLEKKGLNIFIESQRLNTFKKNKYLIHLPGNLKSRCTNSKDIKFKYYGAKGIKNLLSKNDIVFIWKRDKGYLLKKPSIDRINNKGNYCLENCRFIEKHLNVKSRKNT